MLIDEEFDFLIASLALCVGIFALRAISSLAHGAFGVWMLALAFLLFFCASRDSLACASRSLATCCGGRFCLRQNCAGIIFALRVCFLGSLCGAKLGFGGKPLL